MLQPTNRDRQIPEEQPSVGKTQSRETSKAGKTVPAGILSKMDVIRAVLSAPFTKMKEGFSKIGAHIEKKIAAKPKEEGDPVKAYFSKTQAMQRHFQSKEVSKFQKDLAWDIEVGRGLMDNINTLEQEMAKLSRDIETLSKGILDKEEANAQFPLQLDTSKEEGEIDAAKTLLSEKETALNEKRAELREHSKDMQKNMDAFQEFQKGGPQIFKLKQKVTEAQNKVDEAEKRLSGATTDVTAAQKRKTEAEKEVESSKGALTQKSGKEVSVDSILDEMEAEEQHEGAAKGLAKAEKGLTSAQAESAKSPEAEAARKDLEKARSDLEKAKGNLGKATKHSKLETRDGLVFGQGIQKQIGMKLCEDLNAEAKHVQFQIGISFPQFIKAAEPKREFTIEEEEEEPIPTMIMVEKNSEGRGVPIQLIDSTTTAVTEDRQKTKKLGEQITECSQRLLDQEVLLMEIGKAKGEDHEEYRTAKESERQITQELRGLEDSLKQHFNDVAEHIQDFEDVLTGTGIDIGDKTKMGEKTGACKELCDQAWAEITDTFNEHLGQVERDEKILPPPLPQEMPPQSE